METLEVIKFIINVLFFVVAVLTLQWRFKKDHREIFDNFRREIEKKQTELYRNTEARTDALEKRVIKIESEGFRNVSDRLGKVEGELKGINNILGVIYEKMVSK